MSAADEAYLRYWNARSSVEQRAAYFEILLRGGKDGYSSRGGWRAALARVLRRAALMVDPW